MPSDHIYRSTWRSTQVIAFSNRLHCSQTDSTQYITAKLRRNSLRNKKREPNVESQEITDESHTTTVIDIHCTQETLWIVPIEASDYSQNRCIPTSKPWLSSARGWARGWADFIHFHMGRISYMLQRRRIQLAIRAS